MDAGGESFVCGNSGEQYSAVDSRQGGERLYAPQRTAIAIVAGMFFVYKLIGAGLGAL